MIIKKMVHGHTFTLVEALVSLTLMAFLVTATSFILVDTKQASDEVWKKTQQKRQLETVLLSIQQDLKKLYHPSDKTQVLLSQSISEGEQQKDSLSFMACQVHDASPRLVEIEYLSSPSYVDPDKNVPNETPGTFSIYRRFDSEADESIGEGGTYELLLSNIKRFSIRYLQQESWTDSPVEIPRLIHIEITHQIDQRSITMDTYVSI
jgi:type II secretory pathway pseudopilin PulG